MEGAVMGDDLHAIHEADQRRERAGAIGGDVAAYYASLIAGDVPADVAAVLTSEMQDLWIGDVQIRANGPFPVEAWEEDD